MSQFIVICFDVRDERRLRKISSELENYGQRVQRSVFECWLDDNDLFALKKSLTQLANAEQDQIRYYSLCPKDVADIQIDGPGSVTRDIRYSLF